MKTIRITLLVATLVTFFTLETKAQYDSNVALGFRVGEPLGLNLRKYFQYGDKAFDINFGTYGFIYGRHRNYRKGEYTKSGLMLNGIYNWHYSLGKNKGLKAYYGVGGQFNFREYVSEENLIGTRQNGEKHLSIGPAGNLGLEYDLPNNDLGVFLDAGAYAELFPDIFFLHPQISAGVRVNLIGGGKRR